MNSIDALRKAVEQLERAFDRAYEDVSDRIAYSDVPVECRVDPYALRAKDGRYILLDALTALVNARMLLAQAESQQPT